MHGRARRSSVAGAIASSCSPCQPRPHAPADSSRPAVSTSRVCSPPHESPRNRPRRCASSTPSALPPFIAQRPRAAVMRTGTACTELFAQHGNTARWLPINSCLQAASSARPCSRPRNNDGRSKCRRDGDGRHPRLRWPSMRCLMGPVGDGARASASIQGHACTRAHV
jgi:hypothetical protein